MAARDQDAEKKSVCVRALVYGWVRMVTLRCVARKIMRRKDEDDQEQVLENLDHFG